jgi:anti-sigma factor RsiW
MTNQPMMKCDGVDEALLEYLEGTLDGVTRGAVEQHVSSCLRCNALLRDIESIRTGASDLPELVPSHDLWAGIASRIEPAVVPLGVQSRREVRRSWIPAMAAAAAALVIATAGITYVATTRNLGSSSARVAVGSKPAASRVAAAPTPVKTTIAADVEAPQAQETSPTREPRSAGSSGNGGVTLASRESGAAVSQSEIAYGDEIARLQKIIAQRKGQLDPATVAVVEQNLKIIDAAVRQSRAALARDPASGFLTDQLNHVLDKKIELLRTVALLPSTT